MCIKIHDSFIFYHDFLQVVLLEWPKPWQRNSVAEESVWTLSVPVSTKTKRNKWYKFYSSSSPVTLLTSALFASPYLFQSNCLFLRCSLHSFPHVDAHGSNIWEKNVMNNLNKNKNLPRKEQIAQWTSNWLQNRSTIPLQRLIFLIYIYVFTLVSNCDYLMAHI